MIATAKRHVLIYGAFAAVVPKIFLAYRSWVWLNLFVQALAMTIFVFFWRAVYVQTNEIGGLTYQQTLNYVMLAQIVGRALRMGVIQNIGQMLREGTIGSELVRPVDFQFANYVRSLAHTVLNLVFNIPLLLLAILYGAQFPTDPLVWLCFTISLFLGVTVLFMFDWAFACVAFYTTEVWGVMVLQYGIWQFFSGALLPLVMMPVAMQAIAAALPFAQALYVPVALLSGTVPISEAPQNWLVQLLWLVGMTIASRMIFNIAIRKITVQGG